jgi:hypothetical protein
LLNTIEVPNLDHNDEPTNNPDEAATWKTITDPLMIEEQLLARNITHFGQAQGTLFATQRLQNLFGYCGVNQTAQKVLQGHRHVYSGLELSPGGTSLLNLLSNADNLSEISSSISLKTFTSAMRKWSERTSTSPSGRHLGHYKCPLADDHHEYPETDPDPGGEIFRFYHQKACSALNWGISLDRWQTSITSMIEKVPGCPKINKLRVIHLYEADYNLLLKIMWSRRLVWNAHDKDRLNKGQAGSHPGRNIDVVNEKGMKYLYSI